MHSAHTNSKVQKGAQFHKTKLCPWYQGNRCNRPETCRFAHSEQELQAHVDLTKTSLCPSHYKHGACHNTRCRFAHSVGELRFTHHYYKTSLCKYFVAGKCLLGLGCRYAHGSEEMNLSQQEKLLRFEVGRAEYERGTQEYKQLFNAAFFDANAQDNHPLAHNRAPLAAGPAPYLPSSEEPSFNRRISRRRPTAATTAASTVGAFGDVPPPTPPQECAPPQPPHPQAMGSPLISMDMCMNAPQLISNPPAPLYPQPLPPQNTQPLPPHPQPPQQQQQPTHMPAGTSPPTMPMLVPFNFEQMMHMHTHMGVPLPIPVSFPGGGMLYPTALLPPQAHAMPSLPPQGGMECVPMSLPPQYGVVHTPYTHTQPPIQEGKKKKHTHTHTGPAVMPLLPQKMCVSAGAVGRSAFEREFGAETHHPPPAVSKQWDSNTNTHTQTHTAPPNGGRRTISLAKPRALESDLSRAPSQDTPLPPYGWLRNEETPAPTPNTHTQPAAPTTAPPSSTKSRRTVVATRPPPMEEAIQLSPPVHLPPQSDARTHTHTLPPPHPFAQQPGGSPPHGGAGLVPFGFMNPSDPLAVAMQQWVAQHQMGGVGGNGGKINTPPASNTPSSETPSPATFPLPHTHTHTALTHSDSMRQGSGHITPPSPEGGPTHTHTHTHTHLHTHLQNMCVSAEVLRAAQPDLYED